MWTTIKGCLYTILIQGEKMKYLLSLSTLLLLLGCNTPPPKKEPIFSKPTHQMLPRKEALIVGVSDYAGITDDLAGVKKDVVNMRNLFSEWGFHVTVLMDKDALKLEENLQRYVGLNANDKFIFYYSGHGSHTTDESGDEDDGEDEALVLSDGVKNKLFLDDSLFGYLNSIKAQKMVMLDSCHSGTAFKAFGDEPKPKSLESDIKHLFKIIKSKIFPTQNSNINSGDYIVFSASQDNEQSLDTKSGGMFTKAFYKEVHTNNGKNIKMMNLRGAIAKEIRERCKESGSTVHHPNISASSNKLKYQTLGEFLEL